MRNKSLVEERTKYVKKIIEKAVNNHQAVKKLAKELFVCESTIYKDLAK